jgi:hypothetical protein
LRNKNDAFNEQLKLKKKNISIHMWNIWDIWINWILFGDKL